MIYPMKKRVWINGERLDNYEKRRDEVTKDGEATLLDFLDIVDDVIIRVFGDGFSVGGHGRGLVIDPFNGDIVILNRDNVVDINNIGDYDGIHIDVNAYFVIIDYTFSFTNSTCSDDIITKPALDPPKNATVITVNLIKVPTNVTEDMGYPFVWCTPISKNLKSVCDKMHNADILPNDEACMYMQFNEDHAPVCVKSSLVANAKLIRTMQFITKNINEMMRTRAGLVKGTIAVLNDGRIVKIQNNIPNSYGSIVVRTLNYEDSSEYAKFNDYPYYEFISKLAGVFPENACIVTPFTCYCPEITEESYEHTFGEDRIVDDIRRTLPVLCDFEECEFTVGDPIFVAINKLFKFIGFRDLFYLALYGAIYEVNSYTIPLTNAVKCIKIRRRN